MTFLAALLLLVSAGSERENRRGIEAWRRGDTTAAIRHFSTAARRDSTQSDYAFNAGTLKSLSGQDAEADLSAALARARSDEEKARALYNRGTARLSKAASAPPGQGDVGGAISDLRQAVRMRPGWNEASRNLDRALRLRPPPQPKQDPKPDDKSDPKPDQKNKPNENKPSQGDKPQDAQPPQPDPSPGMDPQDAQRLLDGAAAREAQQQREQRRKRPEDNDGPDW